MPSTRMRTRYAVLITVPLFVFSVFGEMPPVETVKDDRYVIPAGRPSQIPLTDYEIRYRPEGMRGVWKWDLDPEAWRPLFPSIYGEFGVGEGAAITAMEDRIVVQGETFLEFDAVTYRLLRRYPALAKDYRWAFRGPLVSETQASRLGIDPGYYGHPHCPPSRGALGPICSEETFPGYPSTSRSDTHWNLLHRRELDPGSLDLSLAKSLPVFESQPTSEPWYHLALDSSRSRFWFYHDVYQRRQIRFGYLPIQNGTIGDEVILELVTFDADTPPAQQHSPRALFFDPVSDSLVTRWQPQSGPPFVTIRPADLSRPDEIIPSGNRLPLAMTGLDAGLPETYLQVVPAIARAPGALGTFWQSDVWIFNPSDEPSTFSIRRVSKPDVTIERTLAPHASLELADALGMLGGGPSASGGDGTSTDALVIEAPYRWGAQLAIHSRTYTSDANGGGTYGQSVPAVPTREGYSTQLPHAQLAGPVAASTSEFYLDLRYPGMFRHNLGVVNDSAEPLDVDLYYGTPHPSPDREPARTITVASHSVANVNLENLLGAEMSPDRASMMVIAAPRPAPVWLSMVDNRSGDATFVPFATFSLEGAYDTSMVIPQVANTPGGHNSFWRSDLYGVYLPPASGVIEPQSPKAYFHPSDPALCGGGSEPHETILYGPTGQPGHPQTSPYPELFRRVFPDVVKQFAACKEMSITGALELNIGSWMSGFARTYTTRPDGGTYGDMLPFYPAGGWPVQHFSGVTIDPRLRTNVGLYNGLDYPVAHRLLVYDRAGNEVRRRELTIEPDRSMQAPLGAIVGDLPPGLYGLTVLPLDAGDKPGRSWAYVSIVDNLTGDPTNLW